MENTHISSTHQKRKKRNLFHGHAINLAHQNLIWKMEANVDVVNKLSSSEASSRLFQASEYTESRHTCFLDSPLAGKCNKLCTMTGVNIWPLFKQIWWRKLEEGSSQGSGLISTAVSARRGGEDKGGRGGIWGWGRHKASCMSQNKIFPRAWKHQMSPVWVVYLCNVFYRACLFMGVWFGVKGRDRVERKATAKASLVLFLAGLRCFQGWGAFMHRPVAFLNQGCGGY